MQRPGFAFSFTGLARTEGLAAKARIVKKVDNIFVYKRLSP